MFSGLTLNKPNKLLEAKVYPIETNATSGGALGVLRYANFFSSN